MMVEVEQDELNATRQAAAEMIPWKSEAHRLADALYIADPAHPLLKSEIWEARMRAIEERGATDQAIGPDDEMRDAIIRAVTP